MNRFFTPKSCDTENSFEFIQINDLLYGEDLVNSFEKLNDDDFEKSFVLLYCDKYENTSNLNDTDVCYINIIFINLKTTKIFMKIQKLPNVRKIKKLN